MPAGYLSPGYPVNRYSPGTPLIDIPPGKPWGWNLATPMSRPLVGISSSLQNNLVKPEISRVPCSLAAGTLNTRWVADAGRVMVPILRRIRGYPFMEGTRRVAGTLLPTTRVLASNTWYTNTRHEYE